MIYIYILLSFLAGSIPFGFLIAKFVKGIDIREHGSGNLGATNVFRILGAGPGIAAFLLDFLKGFLPVFIAMRIFSGQNELFFVITGLAAVLGHIFTPFLGFKGGKGVATGTGVFAALLPGIILLAAAVFAITFAVSRYVSLSSIVAAVFITLTVWLTGKPLSISIFATLTAILIIYTHRPNIKRLMNGTENKFILRKEDKNG